MNRWVNFRNCSVTPVLHLFPKTHPALQGEQTSAQGTAQSALRHDAEKRLVMLLPRTQTALAMLNTTPQ